MKELIFCVGIFLSLLLISWIHKIVLRNKSLYESNEDKNYQWHCKKIELFDSFADKANYIETKLEQAKSLPRPQKMKLLAVCEDLVSDLTYFQGKTRSENKYSKELVQKTLKASREAFHEG